MAFFYDDFLFFFETKKITDAFDRYERIYKFYVFLFVSIFQWN